MDTGQIVAALNTVEQDHQLVLIKVQALKEIVQLLLGPQDVPADQVLGQLRALKSDFTGRLAAHLQEEETTLFPFLEARHPGGKELAARLRKERDQLRAKRRDMDGCLELATGLEDRVPSAVMRDLLIYGCELWDLLDQHAYTATRAVHECLAAILPAAAKPAP